ncbi:MAG: hypothetical protein WD595_03100 [Waddliaceae bacterium]
MNQNLIVIEQLRMAPKQMAPFTEFYHHEYLPEVLKLPDVLSVNRYEEYGTEGNLAWFDQSFLTVYQLSKGAGSIDDFETLMKQIPEPLQKQMNDFKFNFFFRDLYSRIFTHADFSDIDFANGPFFTVTVETEGSGSKEFHHWYENEYLPKTMADIPTWIDCKRYQSQTRSPTHYHTVYRAANMDDLERGFQLLRAPYRYGSNEDWDSWVGNAISKQNATSFRQIYHRKQLLA